MNTIQKSLALTAIAAVLALLVVPAVSAIIICEDCPGPTNDRCFGVCNGHFARYCVDYILYGCTPTLFAPPADSLEAIFPQPFFLLPAEVAFTPADAEGCQIQQADE